METVLITGGTGMIGSAISASLIKKGYNIIVLTRSPSHKAIPGIRYAAWNINAGTIDETAISEADHIIHLAGADVSEKRWTKKRKQEIVDSRVESGKLLATSLQNIPNRVKTVISISGIGYYGPDHSGETNFTEDDPGHNDFLAITCKNWEAALTPVTLLDKRLVIFRTGVVLSKASGALPKFLKPLRFGMASILGSGKQVMSWIHIEDLVRLFISSIEQNNYSGIYNAVAPQPVSNKEFVLELAKTKKNFFIPMHIPSFMLKLLLGEMSIEVLKSATVSSGKIQEAGFKFQYPDIRAALGNLLKKNAGSGPA